jgi:hypothetical protein
MLHMLLHKEYAANFAVRPSRKCSVRAADLFQNVPHDLAKRFSMKGHSPIVINHAATGRFPDIRSVCLDPGFDLIRPSMVTLGFAPTSP